MAAYTAGTIEIEASDMLILYSDGINEATDQNDEEFGEDRIKKLISKGADDTLSEVCERTTNEVTALRF